MRTSVNIFNKLQHSRPGFQNCYLMKCLGDLKNNNNKKRDLVY